MCDPELLEGQGVHGVWKFSLLTNGSGASGNGSQDCQNSAFFFCLLCVCVYAR